MHALHIPTVRETCLLRPLYTGSWFLHSAASHHRLVVGSPLHGLIRRCPLGRPLLHRTLEPILGGALGLQGDHLLHELVVGTVLCIGLGLCVLLLLQLSLVCSAPLLKICHQAQCLWWPLASKCANCAPGLVLSLGFLWCAGCVLGIQMQAHSQGELPQLGLGSLTTGRLRCLPLVGVLSSREAMAPESIDVLDTGHWIWTTRAQHTRDIHCHNVREYAERHAPDRRQPPLCMMDVIARLMNIHN